MKHKVKITVIDKSFTRNYKSSIALTLIPEPVLATMSEMNLNFIETMKEMIFGTWD